MAKRSNGEGTIAHQVNGSWRARITLEKKRISFTARTRKECQDWLKKTTGQVDQGLTFEGSRTVFSQVLKDWLSGKENRVRIATFEQYRRMIKKYIEPQLGTQPAKDISAAMLQAFYNRLLDQGTGKRTIEIIHTILHGVLDYALRLGLVSRNSAEMVEAPRPEKHEMQVWNESQVSIFLASCPDPLYRLAFATGMRRGELVGLKWEDLDTRGKKITVRRQVYNPEGGGFRFQEPKTNRGRRSVPIGPELVKMLQEQFNQGQPLARELAGDRWQEHDLIFPSTIGTPRNGYEVSKKFAKLVAAAGLPKIRFHDIRHTAASLMLQHGIPPVQVAAMLGQSLAILMDTYAHYIPGNEETAALLMDQITSPDNWPWLALNDQAGESIEKKNQPGG